MSDATSSAAPKADTVDFVIGGQTIPIRLLSYSDAKRVGLLHPDLIARAEHAIEMVAALAAEPGTPLAALYTKDNLMAACSAGEAVGLLDSMRELMIRSGFPAAPAAPPAPPAATAPAAPSGRWGRSDSALRTADIPFLIDPPAPAAPGPSPNFTSAAEPARPPNNPGGQNK